VSREDRRPYRRRHRPGFIARAIQWRVEVVAASSLGVLVAFVNHVVVYAIAGTAAILIVSVPHLRRAAVRAWLLVVLPHRVRSGLAQSSAVDLDGRPPWVLWASSAGPNVIKVEVKLRSGITADDLFRATGYIAGACAAPEVRVFLHEHRPDRASVFLVRPRWGLR
jgi:hypothetical protein